MDILLFTKSKPVIQSFAAVQRSRSLNLVIHPVEDLKKIVKAIQSPSLLYLDIGGMGESEAKRVTGTLAKNETLRYGIIDQAGSIPDPASAFHRGAVDFLHKGVLNDGVTTPRIHAALKLKPFAEDVTEKENTHRAVDKKNWKLAPKGWTGIKSGQEYTFCMLLVEIDMVEEWTQKSGKAHLDEVMSLFHNHIERHVEPLNGKIWMWMNQSGLILFPFDGERIDAILTCIRLVLNRTIISAEVYPYNTIITYRMVLHLGNTVYRSRGKTGTIVSDTINFLFHVGKQFSQRGNFYVTDPVVSFIPERLRSCFVPAGTFEGVDISRMRLPRE